MDPSNSLLVNSIFEKYGLAEIQSITADDFIYKVSLEVNERFQNKTPLDVSFIAEIIATSSTMDNIWLNRLVQLIYKCSPSKIGVTKLFDLIRLNSDNNYTIDISIHSKILHIFNDLLINDSPQAIYFPGDRLSYLQLPVMPISCQQSNTLSIWCKFDSFPLANDVLLFRCKTQHGGIEAILSNSSTHEIGCLNIAIHTYVEKSTGQMTREKGDIQGKLFLIAQKWHMLTLSHINSTGTDDARLSLHIDNMLIMEKELLYPFPSISSDSDWKVGIYFQGCISSITLYNIALNDKLLAILYDNGPTVSSLNTGVHVPQNSYDSSTHTLGITYTKGHDAFLCSRIRPIFSFQPQHFLTNQLLPISSVGKLNPDFVESVHTFDEIDANKTPMLLNACMVTNANTSYYNTNTSWMDAFLSNGGCSNIMYLLWNYVLFGNTVQSVHTNNNSSNYNGDENRMDSKDIVVMTCMKDTLQLLSTLLALSVDVRDQFIQEHGYHTMSLCLTRYRNIYSLINFSPVSSSPPAASTSSSLLSFASMGATAGPSSTPLDGNVLLPIATSTDFIDSCMQLIKSFKLDSITGDGLYSALQGLLFSFRLWHDNTNMNNLIYLIECVKNLIQSACNQSKYDASKMISSTSHSSTTGGNGSGRLNSNEHVLYISIGITKLVDMFYFYINHIHHSYISDNMTLHHNMVNKALSQMVSINTILTASFDVIKFADGLYDLIAIAMDSALSIYQMKQSRNSNASNGLGTSSAIPMSNSNNSGGVGNSRDNKYISVASGSSANSSGPGPGFIDLEVIIYLIEISTHYLIIERMLRILNNLRFSAPKLLHGTLRSVQFTEVTMLHLLCNPKIYLSTEIRRTGLILLLWYYNTYIMNHNVYQQLLKYKHLFVHLSPSNVNGYGVNGNTKMNKGHNSNNDGMSLGNVNKSVFDSIITLKAIIKPIQKIWSTVVNMTRVMESEGSLSNIGFVYSGDILSSIPGIGKSEYPGIDFTTTTIADVIDIFMHDGPLGQTDLIATLPFMCCFMKYTSIEICRDMLLAINILLKSNDSYCACMCVIEEYTWVKLLLNCIVDVKSKLTSAYAANGSTRMPSETGPASAAASGSPLVGEDNQPFDWTHIKVHPTTYISDSTNASRTTPAPLTADDISIESNGSNATGATNILITNVSIEETIESVKTCIELCIDNIAQIMIYKIKYFHSNHSWFNICMILEYINNHSEFTSSYKYYIIRRFCLLVIQRLSRSNDSWNTSMLACVSNLVLYIEDQGFCGNNNGSKNHKDHNYNIHPNQHDIFHEEVFHYQQAPSNTAQPFATSTISSDPLKISSVPVSAQSTDLATSVGTTNDLIDFLDLDYSNNIHTKVQPLPVSSSSTDPFNLFHEANGIANSSKGNGASGVFPPPMQESRIYMSINEIQMINFVIDITNSLKRSCDLYNYYDTSVSKIVIPCIRILLSVMIYIPSSTPSNGGGDNNIELVGNEISNDTTNSSRRVDDEVPSICQHVCISLQNIIYHITEKWTFMSQTKFHSLIIFILRNLQIIYYDTYLSSNLKTYYGQCILSIVTFFIQLRYTSVNKNGTISIPTHAVTIVEILSITEGCHDIDTLFMLLHSYLQQRYEPNRPMGHHKLKKKGMMHGHNSRKGRGAGNADRPDSGVVSRGVGGGGGERQGRRIDSSNPPPAFHETISFIEEDEDLVAVNTNMEYEQAAKYYNNNKSDNANNNKNIAISSNNIDLMSFENGDTRDGFNRNAQQEGDGGTDGGTAHEEGRGEDDDDDDDDEEEDDDKLLVFFDDFVEPSSETQVAASSAGNTYASSNQHNPQISNVDNSTVTNLLDMHFDDYSNATSTHSVVTNTSSVNTTTATNTSANSTVATGVTDNLLDLTEMSHAVTSSTAATGDVNTNSMIVENKLNTFNKSSGHKKGEKLLLIQKEEQSLLTNQKEWKRIRFALLLERIEAQKERQIQYLNVIEYDMECIYSYWIKSKIKIEREIYFIMNPLVEWKVGVTHEGNFPSRKRIVLKPITERKIQIHGKNDFDCIKEESRGADTEKGLNRSGSATGLNASMTADELQQVLQVNGITGIMASNAAGNNGGIDGGWGVVDVDDSEDGYGVVGVANDSGGNLTSSHATNASGNVNNSGASGNYLGNDNASSLSIVDNNDDTIHGGTAYIDTGPCYYGTRRYDTVDDIVSVDCILVTASGNHVGKLSFNNKEINFVSLSKMNLADSAEDEEGDENEGRVARSDSTNNHINSADKGSRGGVQASVSAGPAGHLEDSSAVSLVSSNKLRKRCRWNVSSIHAIYLRRYRLRDTAVEVFLSRGKHRNFFIDFGSSKNDMKRRNAFAKQLMNIAPTSAFKQWPNMSIYRLVSEHNIQQRWIDHEISNFDYLMALNTLSGRSYNDLCQYPVMPWVLSQYTESSIDLNDPSNYRDLSKPMGAQNPQRLIDYQSRYQSFQESETGIPAFMYGSHYSTMVGCVLYFLIRLQPFSSLHVSIQNGHFDVSDRLFSSIARTYEHNTNMLSEVKELIPEFFYLPEFLTNINQYNFGVMQSEEVVDNVILPPWSKTPEEFIRINREALESPYVSAHLHEWIDLIFGYKQRGEAAVEANNVFYYLTYYGAVNRDLIKDETMRKAIELQIAHFGQCPMELFSKPHPSRKMVLSIPRMLINNFDKCKLFYLDSISKIMLSSISSSEKSVVSISQIMKTNMNIATGGNHSNTSGHGSVLNQPVTHTTNMTYTNIEELLCIEASCTMVNRINTIKIVDIFIKNDKMICILDNGIIETYKYYTSETAKQIVYNKNKELNAMAANNINNSNSYPNMAANDVSSSTSQSSSSGTASGKIANKLNIISRRAAGLKSASITSLTGGGNRGSVDMGTSSVLEVEDEEGVGRKMDEMISFNDDEDSNKNGHSNEKDDANARGTSVTSSATVPLITIPSLVEELEGYKELIMKASKHSGDILIVVEKDNTNFETVPRLPLIHPKRANSVDQRMMFNKTSNSMLTYTKNAILETNSINVWFSKLNPIVYSYGRIDGGISIREYDSICNIVSGVEFTGHKYPVACMSVDEVNHANTDVIASVDIQGYVMLWTCSLISNAITSTNSSAGNATTKQQKNKSNSKRYAISRRPQRMFYVISDPFACCDVSWNLGIIVVGAKAGIHVFSIEKNELIIYQNIHDDIKGWIQLCSEEENTFNQTNEYMHIPSDDDTYTNNDNVKQNMINAKFSTFTATSASVNDKNSNGNSLSGSTTGNTAVNARLWSSGDFVRIRQIFMSNCGVVVMHVEVMNPLYRASSVGMTSVRNTTNANAGNRTLPFLHYIVTYSIMGTKQCIFKGHGASNEITFISVPNKGDMICVGYQDGLVQLLLLSTLNVVFHYYPHQHALKCVLTNHNKTTEILVPDEKEVVGSITSVRLGPRVDNPTIIAISTSNGHLYVKALPDFLRWDIKTRDIGFMSQAVKGTLQQAHHLSIVATETAGAIATNAKNFADETFAKLNKTKLFKGVGSLFGVGGKGSDA